MKTRIFVTVLLIVCLIGLSDQTVKAQDNEITITDLGTLGEASYPWNLNDLGQVVGESDAGFGDRRSFLWTEEGGMQDLLNPIFGGHYGQAIYINNLGQIVGHYYPTGYQHAFLWSSVEGFLDLGTLTKDPTQGGSSYPLGVNNSGQVIGFSTGTMVYGVWQTHAFLWHPDKGMKDLGTLASAYASNSRAEATDINEAGEVVGWSDTPSLQAHVFLWTPENGLQDLGIVIDPYSGLDVYINNYGQIAGTRYTDSGEHLAFTWTSENGLSDLGTLSGVPGSESFVSGLNDHGQIIGWSETQDGFSHAFLWAHEDGMIDLGVIGGEYSGASDINNSGQVVGTSGIGSGEYHAFLWTDKDGMVDLGTLGGNSSATKINNNGQIIGVSKPGGLLRATLWTIPRNINITIDIKPGSYPNSINLGSKGVVPVAVLTTDDFDAGDLDPATVLFAGASPLRWSWQDVDWDGDMDLLFHFKMLELQLDESSIVALLTGKTIDGISVEGSDSVKIVPVQ